MDEVLYIDADGGAHALPALGGRVLVPRDLIAARPELLWASEHEEAGRLSPALRARLAAIEVGEGRRADPGRGAFWVPEAEWSARARAAAALPAAPWPGAAPWPRGAPWPAPIPLAPPPHPRAPRARADLMGGLARAGVGLLALINLGVLAAAVAWALGAWGRMDPNDLLGGALILAAAGLVARLSGGAPSAAGALARLALAVVLGALVLSTLLA